MMWATDATQIATVRDGKVWMFGVAEHWNAELLGWHVAKRGTRFEALQAVGMAVRNQFDRVDAGTARGLALRHDHGSNFMSDAFQKQIRSWGIAPSYAFVGEPQTKHLHLHAKMVRRKSDIGAMKRDRSARIGDNSTVTRSTLPTPPLVGSKSIHPAPGK